VHIYIVHGMLKLKVKHWYEFCLNDRHITLFSSKKKMPAGRKITFDTVFDKTFCMWNFENLVNKKQTSLMNGKNRTLSLLFLSKRRTKSSEKSNTMTSLKLEHTKMRKSTRKRNKSHMCWNINDILHFFSNICKSSPYLPVVILTVWTCLTYFMFLAQGNCVYFTYLSVDIKQWKFHGCVL
jgi:hypothetical protein